MNLKDVFKEQKDFQRYFYNPDEMSEEEKIKFTKEYILSIHRELSEILDTIPWKLHRKEDKVKSENNTIEEIIDAFKFLLNLCIIWGIDDEKFVDEFFRKSMVVRQRYNQEILKVIGKEDKVCAIDLDDTIANSDDHFTEVYNKKNNTSFKTRSQIKGTIDTLDYEDFKDFFRESGEKLNIPVKEGAKELCDYLKQIGYKIVIISARPYEKYSRIFPDTLQWLNKNEIQYDAVYFEKDKHIKILRYLPHLSFIVEDDPLYAEQISEQGYKVYLLYDSKIENKKENRNVVVINNLIEIKKYENN